MNRTVKAVTDSKFPRWYITMIISIALWLLDSVNLTVVGFEEDTK